MPFAGYKDFDDCVSKNKDKGNPQAYCAVVHKKSTGKWPTEKEKFGFREKLEAMNYLAEASREQVIDAFVKGLPERSANLNSTGQKLMSYNTVIADWSGGKIRINKQKYSQTTTTQTNALKRAAQSVGISVEEVDANVLN